MENIFKKFTDESSKYYQRIIYDEIEDSRIRKAIFELKNEWYSPVLCNKKDILEKYYWEELEQFEYIICPDDEDPTMFAWKMHSEWKVDWFISWALNTTSHTIKSLIKNTWAKEWIKRISGYFLMNTSRGLILIADCAVQPNPDSEQLAEIAYLSAKSALSFGMNPKIWMLSFSTKWSAINEISQKVIDATNIAKKRFEEENMLWLVEIEWELQLDSAIVPAVAKTKIKDGSWSWEANVLIFPDLNSWNIGYKLIQYYGWAQAIWPIIQWLNKPWNDLSRGCIVEDIKILHSVTVIQAEKNK